MDWGTVGSATLTLAGASATGNGGVLVVSANASGHNLTITGPVTAVAGNIFLAADDNFIDSASIGGSNFSGTVYMAGNRDTGNTGTLTMTAGATSAPAAQSPRPNTSVYNPATQTPGAVLLEDYSASGTAAGDLTLGNITVGVGGSITATTIPTLGLYNPAVPPGQRISSLGPRTSCSPLRWNGQPDRGARSVIFRRRRHWLLLHSHRRLRCQRRD